MPEFLLLRIYLDANVLFSASRDPASRFLGFWKLQDVVIVTSRYAADEALRNIDVADHRNRLEVLLAQTEFVSDADVRVIPADVRLAVKDQPILAAAIAARVDYLVTGDKNHFNHLYLMKVSGVCVISPAEFLSRHEDRLPE